MTDSETEVSSMGDIERPEPGHYAETTGAWEDQMADDVHRWAQRCFAAEEERDAARQQLEGAVDALRAIGYPDDFLASRSALSGKARDALAALGVDLSTTRGR